MLHFLLILEILLCQQYLLVQNNEKQAGAELVHPQLKLKLELIKCSNNLNFFVWHEIIFILEDIFAWRDSPSPLPLVTLLIVSHGPSPCPQQYKLCHSADPSPANSAISSCCQILINQCNVTNVNQSTAKSQSAAELGPAQPQLVSSIFLSMI